MRRFFSFTPPFFSAFIKLIFFFALSFFLIRVLFCAFNIPKNIHEPIIDFISAFVLGLRFDMIIASFVLMLPLLILFVHQMFLRKSRVLLHFAKIYFMVISALVFLISCANIPYFSQFGSHINKNILVWRLSPGYTLELIFSSFYYWGFFLLFAGIVFMLTVVTKHIFKAYEKEVSGISRRAYFKETGYFILMAFILFVLARGRLSPSSRSTMHEGMAIVSQNTFMNQIALNPSFTLIKSFERKEGTKAYLRNIERDLRICRSYYRNNYFPPGGQIESQIVADNSPDSIKPLNVIIVLMESLSMSKMGHYGSKNLSPNLHALSKESIYFDRFFSAGIHTFNGLFSSTTGFPTIYTEQSLRQYTKQPFTTLANLLKGRGYHSYFCCTHDPVFDNMEGFFKLNGFDNLISDRDFDHSQSLGVTGIPDHLLYQKLVETINVKEKNDPFVALVMTGTDHGPWHIPKNISFVPSGADEKENASLYADWAVGQLIAEAKKHDWYKNTVFVFLGDHGQLGLDPYEMAITYHHMPLILHCPGILSPELNHNLGTQQDLVKTISSVLGLKYRNFSFGVNILKEKRGFVSFSADDKLGYVTDDDYFFYHLLSTDKKAFVKYFTMEGTNYYQKNKARADSLYDLSMSLYNAAQYYIRENYFNF